MEAYALEQTYQNADSSSQLTFDQIVGREGGAAAIDIQRNGSTSKQAESILPKVTIDKGGKQGSTQTTEMEGEASGSAGEASGSAGESSGSSGESHPSRCGEESGGPGTQPMTGSEGQPLNPRNRSNEKQQSNTDNLPEPSRKQPRP